MTKIESNGGRKFYHKRLNYALCAFIVRSELDGFVGYVRWMAHKRNKRVWSLS